MGVHGLWKLLEPSARPVRLEALRGKRLAVDASIWLHQFLKAMRTSDGSLLAGAHLQGFFRRICKLLYFGILPVFVFDGRTPELKKVALKRRRAQRKTAEDSLSRTAHKLLVKRMELELTKTSNASSEQSVESTTKKQSAKKGKSSGDFFEDEVYYMNEQGEHISSKELDKIAQQKKKQERELVKQMEKEKRNTIIDERLISSEELKSYVDVSAKDIDLSAVNLNDEAFKGLPIELQHDIITELKQRSRMASGRRLQSMLNESGTDSRDFSKMQIKHLIVRNDLTQRAYDFAQNAGVTSNPGLKKRIEEAKKKDKGYHNSDLVAKRRVAGERNMEYFLIRDKDGGGHTLNLEDTEESKFEKKNASPTYEMVDVLDNGGSVLNNQFFGSTFGVNANMTGTKTYSKGSDYIRAKRVIGNTDNVHSKNSKSRKVVDISSESKPYADTVKLDDLYFIDKVGEEKEYVVSDDDPSPDVFESMTAQDILEQKAILESHNNSANIALRTPSQQLPSYKLLSKHDRDTVVSLSGALLEVSQRDELDSFWNTLLTKKDLCRYLIDKCIPDEYKSVDPRIVSLLTEALVIWDAEGFNRYFDEVSELMAPLEEKSIDDAHFHQLSIQDYVDKISLHLTTNDMPNFETKMKNAKQYLLANLYYKEIIYNILYWRRKNGDLKEKVIEENDDSDEDFEEIGPAVEDEPLFSLPKDASKVTANPKSDSLFADLDEPTATTARLGLFDDLGFDDDLVHGELKINQDDKTSIGKSLFDDLSSTVKPDVGVVSNDAAQKSIPDEKIIEAVPQLKDEEIVSIETDKEDISIKDESDDEDFEEVSPIGGNIPVAHRIDNKIEDIKSLPNIEEKTEIDSLVEADEMKEIIESSDLEQEIMEFEPTGEVEAHVHHKVDKSVSKPKSPVEVQPELIENDKQTQLLNTVQSSKPQPKASPNKRVEEIKRTELVDDSDNDSSFEQEEYLEYGGIDTNVNLETENEEFVKFVGNASNVTNDNSNAHRMQTIEELERDMLSLKTKKRKDEIISQNVEQEQIFDIQQLLGMFGIPYITAYTEAESQCAYLAEKKLVDGIITDDSDVFLFGGTTVYKNMFNQQKYVEEFQAATIQNKMNLNRENLIQLAYLLGSDYTEGLVGVGITNAVEILDVWRDEGLIPIQSFKKFCIVEKRSKELIQEDGYQDEYPEIEIDESKIEPKVLKRFRKLAEKIKLPPHSFPDPNVREAYLHPVVNTDETKFLWGRPDFELVKNLMIERGQMNGEQVDRVLVPIVKELEKNGAGGNKTLSQQNSQTNISSYITVQPSNVHHPSQRINSVLTKWKNKKK